MKKAFTMIELVFVIVVLGILSAVAVPKLSATRDDAQIAKGRADVASIRAGIISERQTRLMRGDSKFITTTNLDSGGLFGGVLMYPKVSSTASGHWSGGGGTYTYNLNIGSVKFTYNASTGIFTCTTGANCNKLIK